MIDTQAARKRILQKLHAPTAITANGNEINAQAHPGHLSASTTTELCDLFTRILSAHNTTVVAIKSFDDFPFAVSNYLQPMQIGSEVYGGNNPFLKPLAWEKHGLHWQTTDFTDDGHVAIASADYGIAETGTVVILSSDKNPTRNNFLAEHHIVIIRRDSILPYSENVWQHLRQDHPTLPRAINFISGPSSSADVGLKLEYGAHGPRSLAIFIVD